MAITQVMVAPKAFRDWTKYHPAVYLAYTRLGTDWYRISGMRFEQQQDFFSPVWAEIQKMAVEGFDFASCLPVKEQLADVKKSGNAHQRQRAHAARSQAKNDENLAWILGD